MLNTTDLSVKTRTKKRTNRRTKKKMRHPMRTHLVERTAQPQPKRKIQRQNKKKKMNLTTTQSVYALFYVHLQLNLERRILNRRHLLLRVRRRTLAATKMPRN